MRRFRENSNVQDCRVYGVCPSNLGIVPAVVWISLAGC